MRRRGYVYFCDSKTLPCACRSRRRRRRGGADSRGAIIDFLYAGCRDSAGFFAVVVVVASFRYRLVRLEEVRGHSDGQLNGWKIAVIRSTSYISVRILIARWTLR